MPGPRSTTRSRMRPPTSRARTETGWPPECRWAFSSRFANARSSWAASARTGGRSASIATLKRLRRQVELVDRGADDLLDRAPLGMRLGGVGLQPREVEQVVDQAREPPRLLGHRRRELGALVRRQRRRVQRLGARQDRGQRRAQVVRDGAQQRGLDHVAAAQRGGLDHLGLQRVALQRRRQQRLQRGRDPDLHAPQHGLRRARGQHQRADLAACPRAARTRRCARRRRRRAARSPRSRARARGRAARRRCGSVSSSRPPRSSSRAISAERSASWRRSSASSARWRAISASELAPAAARKKTASATQFSAGRDREAPGRRDVEEVERERADDRGGERQPGAPHRRHHAARRAGRRRRATGRARRP